MLKNWKYCRLGDVVTLKRGYDLRTADRNQNGIVPVVSSSGVTGLHDQAKVKAPGVVTGRYGTVGQFFYLERDFWPLNTTLYVQYFNGNLPIFIFYFLQTLNFTRYSDKTSVPGINRNELHRIKVQLPPLEEQRKIAEILGAWDEAITLTERLIEAKQKRKKGLMQQLLTGKVRFPGFEGSEWKEAALGKVATIIMGQSPPGTSYNRDGMGLPLINGPTEFTSRIPVPKQYTTKPSKLCQKGDILLCVRGSSTGRINVADREYCIGRGVAAIRAPNSLGSTRYLEFALLRGINKVLAKSVGSTFPNIDRKSLSSIRLLTPSKVEQEKIAQLLMTCDEDINLLQQKAAALRQQKKGLMQQLLTGKVRVKV